MSSKEMKAPTMPAPVQADFTAKFASRSTSLGKESFKNFEHLKKSWHCLFYSLMKNNHALLSHHATVSNKVYALL